MVYSFDANMQSCLAASGILLNRLIQGYIYFQKLRKRINIILVYEWLTNIAVYNSRTSLHHIESTLTLGLHFNRPNNKNTKRILFTCMFTVYSICTYLIISFTLSYILNRGINLHNLPGSDRSPHL